MAITEVGPPFLDQRKPFSAQYDPPIDGGAYCPDTLYVIDDLVGNGRRVGGRQDRLGIAEADVIVAAARFGEDRGATAAGPSVIACDGTLSGSIGFSTFQGPFCQDARWL
jgi:hypothetical protein